MLDELLEIPVFDVELTADCNKTCSYCPRDALGRERFVMSDELVDALLRFVPRRAFVGFAGIGEPLMHPRLFSVIRELRRTGERTIHVTTNGSLLGPKMVERLIADRPDGLTVSVHLDQRDGDGHLVLAPAIERTLGAALSRLREHMGVTVGLMKESYSSAAALAEASARWRAHGADVVEVRDTHNRGGHLGGERALFPLRTSPAAADANRGIKCTIFSRVTFVSSDGDVLACCNDVANQVRLGNVAVDSYSSVVRRKRQHIERDVWPEICVKCNVRRDVPPVSAEFADVGPRLDFVVRGSWMTRDGGFPLGRFHASVVAAACTRVRQLADGTLALEIHEDAVRAVLDRVGDGRSVLVASDADVVIIQSRALRRFGRPVPMVGFAMSAAVVETAVRSLVRAEGEEVRRWLDRNVSPGQLNRNDPDPLAPFSIPASARRFVPAGTYLLRTLADGLGSALDAPRYAGTGVFAGGSSQRDYATLAAAIPAIGAPVSVVGAPEHAALFEGVAGVSFEADLDAKAFLRAMAAARVVVIPLEWTQISAGRLTTAAAQWMGKPVVASDVPGIAGCLDHGVNGLLVPPGQPAALAQAVRSLLEDGVLAERLGEAGRASERARSEASEDLLMGLAESALRASHSPAVHKPSP